MRRVPGSFSPESEHPSNPPEPEIKPEPRVKTEQPASSERTWPPRQCRICLEVVQPSIVTEDASHAFHSVPTPRVIYQSADPDLGRLIRPCKCKGSSRYVHEGCLQEWRHADPAYGKRNYWQCPTCGFRYRLQRMTWARAISHAGTQITLTLAIFLCAIFLLGYVADPIISLYLDPYQTLSSGPMRLSRNGDDSTTSSWSEHMIKGLASVGLLGFVKVFFALSPWQWWNLRSSGLLGGGHRAGTTGRDRMANLSWPVIVLGALTLLWALWKAVRNFSRRTLQRASERVMDVPIDGEDEDELDGPRGDTSS